jgi:hypothetical protein
MDSPEHARPVRPAQVGLAVGTWRLTSDGGLWGSVTRHSALTCVSRVVPVMDDRRTLLLSILYRLVRSLLGLTARANCFAERFVRTPQNRTHRPHADLQSTALAYSAHELRSALDRSRSCRHSVVDCR